MTINDNPLFCFRVIDEMGFWHFINQYDDSCGVYFGKHDRDGSAIYTGDIISFTDCGRLSNTGDFTNCAEVVFTNDRFTLTNFKEDDSETRYGLEHGGSVDWSKCKILKRKTIKDTKRD